MKKTATQWGDESLAEAFHELMNVVIKYAYGQVIYPALQSQDMVCTYI